MLCLKIAQHYQAKSIGIYMYKIIPFFFLFTLNSLAQELKNDSFIKPVIKFGTMFSGYSVWQFSIGYWNEELTYNINPNIYLGFGIETKEIQVLDNSSINFRIEASYGIAKTKEAIIYGSPADFTITSIPVLFWTKLKSSGKLSPFVRIGIGAEYSEFKETYYKRPENGFTVNEWFFCYGISAGIDLNYFENINLSIFVDAITKEKGFFITYQNPRGKQLDLNCRSGNLNCGLEAIYNF